jgi:hypothetical protein
LRIFNPSSERPNLSRAVADHYLPTKSNIQVRRQRLEADALMSQPSPSVATRADGGRGEIRTHGGLAPTAVFKTAALNHSATLPTPNAKHSFGLSISYPAADG